MMWFTLNLIFGLSLHGRAQEPVLEPIQILTRCSLQLSATIPDPQSQIYKDVASHKISAAEGCIQIFDLGQLGANGVLKTPNNPVSRKVLERLHHLHRSWFSAKYFAGSTAESMALTDYEEPPLYFTRAAFLPNAKFSEAVTAKFGLQGVRSVLGQTALPYTQSNAYLPLRGSFPRDYPNHVFRTPYVTFSTSASGLNIPASTKYIDFSTAQVTQYGELIGLRTPTPAKMPNFRSARILSAPVISRDIAAINTLLPHLANVTINEHFGGGILGSQGFIQTNTNLNVSVLPLKEEYTHRRLTARIHEDLLCHQFPNLDPADVATEVQPTSPLLFRQGQSCMQCHSTMDPAAQAYRNIFITFGGVNTKFGFTPFFALKHPVVNNPKYYASTLPTGRLKYRTLLDHSKLVVQNVTSIQDIGNHIAGTNDFYLCAAKKYYKYFTGVDVQLNSYENSKTHPIQAAQQNQVIALSKKLKATQSVRETLKQLFASDVYKAPDFLAREVANEP